MSRFIRHTALFFAPIVFPLFLLASTPHEVIIENASTQQNVASVNADCGRELAQDESLNLGGENPGSHPSCRS
jgi:hypothetical protein